MNITKDVEELIGKVDIGIFDSGIGGITVLRELMKSVPTGVRFHYFGDTARVPYGSKPPSEIKKYVHQVFDFFRSLSVEAIVTACNTSDSILSKEEKKSLEVPFFSIIDPVTEALKNDLPINSSVAIIGTRNTIKRSLYLKKLIGSDNICRISQKACPLFVPLVEEGVWEGTLAETIVRYYLRGIKRFAPDYLILGCTHYPFLLKPIKTYLGEDVKVVDPAEYVAREFKAWIENQQNDVDSTVVFYVTGEIVSFTESLKMMGFDNAKIDSVKHVDISSLEEALWQTR
ncbi:glutamate racemase [Kosmotoga sp.]|jgi:glutamate racemase|uniref:glutamate racemase n=1 Tax=Kosmotoga sp. TaxID=1955248 RepID=UPI0024AC07FA|nr:glutamate racemase [Kosmotoga sp.]MDI3524060.1 glutamate racemase [Kosmotoga sp.]MDK2953479.1 glutamate racemase [Kosmotoga sp.]